MADELTLIGILTDEAFDPQVLFSLKEVKKAFFDCLQLQPMYEPLLEVLHTMYPKKVQPMRTFTGEDEYLT